MKRLLILLVCSLLLGGCWDEKHYKDVTNVSLFGVEGQPGNIKAQFVFPIFEDGSINYSTTTGSGTTVLAAKNDTNTMEGLDVAELQVLLVTEESAKSDLYKYIDALYRDPRNRLSAHMAIVEGELAPYFEPHESIGKDISTYYSELIDTAVRYTLVPEVDLQEVCRLLFEEDISLALPYLEIGKETGVPEIAGTALFNKREYTGKTLDKKESVLLNLLSNKQGKYSRLSYMWKSDKGESPLTVEVIRLHKDWKITDNKIDASYKFKLNVEEFPHDSLDKKKTVKEVEDFLSKELTKDFTKVIHKLQEAKSDAIGFGRPVRAFHLGLWEKGDWNETFSELSISINVKTEILRTGILN